MLPSRTKIWVMTMLETDWPAGLVEAARGFEEEVGVADCDTAGDAREILEVPPPPLVAPVPPCEALVKPAAEEGDWEAAEDAILARLGSWAWAACCGWWEGGKAAEDCVGTDWFGGGLAAADVEMGGSRGCMETCAWIPPGGGRQGERTGREEMRER
jgi:hypothetical protein